MVVVDFAGICVSGASGCYQVVLPSQRFLIAAFSSVGFLLRAIENSAISTPMLHE
jgi:hypothetical protein